MNKKAYIIKGFTQINDYTYCLNYTFGSFHEVHTFLDSKEFITELNNSTLNEILYDDFKFSIIHGKFDGYKIIIEVGAHNE